VLSRVSREDWSAGAFPWLSVREAFIGIVPAVVMSVSFSGELAFEIHVPNNQLYSAYLALRKAGNEFDMILFGSHAVESMRLEKGYRHWKADLITEFNPFESNLDRFVKMGKPDFIGKNSLEEMIANGPRQSFVSMIVDCTQAAAHPGASVLMEDKVVGTVTSGDWGHRINKNIAMAFVDPEYSKLGTELRLNILGKEYTAVVVSPDLYQPEIAAF
jgi:dimethylglycine dehydrogenase